jgi:hypothetical protein
MTAASGTAHRKTSGHGGSPEPNSAALQPQSPASPTAVHHRLAGTRVKDARGAATAAGACGTGP